MTSANKSNKSAFSQRLERDGPILLDGGFATQLKVLGCDIDNALWSAAVLQTNPEAIVAAHRAYLDAGAECITTATYQASREGFAKIGVSSDDADELMLLSISLAQQARRAAGSEAFIAASLGPYGAMLNNGSEYHGNYGVSTTELRDFHAQRLQLFEQSDADVLAFETIPSSEEAQVLAELLNNCAKPAWVSFSCKDASRICDGTPIAEVASLFSNHSAVSTVGINCTPPQYVPALVRVIRRSAPDMHVIAYPNSGEIYNASDGSWSGTVTQGECAVVVAEWIAAGAKLIGGCCRMGPKQIAAMAAALGKESR